MRESLSGNRRWWICDGAPVLRGWDAAARAIERVGSQFVLVDDEEPAVAFEGTAVLGRERPSGDALPILGYVPALPLESLGDTSFCDDYGIKYPYIAGAMANGICSVEMVDAMGRAGMLGFFGAAGLPLEVVDSAIQRLSKSLGNRPFGCNLIHSPDEPRREDAVARLYLRRGVRLVEASAYLDLTLPLIRYRFHGIHRDGRGSIVTPNRVIAKVSRVEVATRFLSPPPERLLAKLVEEGALTRSQAELCRQVPVADELTAEADSGGHTDNRPAMALFPAMVALRDRLQQEYGYERCPRIGLAGGIATAESAAAAFAMGAAWVLTGSVNQACRESGTSETVKRMLAEAGQADIMMAPAADMFEMGVKVQVLKRGTMFGLRASKLYELYKTYDSLDSIPAPERATLEKNLFRFTIEDVWARTREFFMERDPSQIQKAENDPKVKMALVFRWYLGQSSHWANAGDPSRVVDYQVWCGPAIGAFNEWVRGSFLEKPENRNVVTVAMNILYGAAVILRAMVLRHQGVRLPPELVRADILELAEIERRLKPGLFDAI